MEPNMRIVEAIEKFSAIGEDFHGQFMWHILHGFVVTRNDAILLAYHCKSTNLDEPTEENDSDCLYVTYYGGSVRKLLAAFSDWNGLVAFRRGFKLKDKKPKIYNAERMKRIFSQLT
jgi:hypothetical protein